MSPTCPEQITLDTLPQLFAFHRATFGGFTMTAPVATQPDGTAPGAQVPGVPSPTPGTPPAGQQPAAQGPERPDGVTDEEWGALGDAGRRALTREREARQAAERALAARRPTAPTQPRQAQPTQQPAGQQQGQAAQNSQSQNVEGLDVGAIVRQAVEAAVAPFREAEERRQTEHAVERIQSAVIDAARNRLHDPTDALAGIDLTQVTDGNGAPDPTRIAAALDDLVTRKPHLAKPVIPGRVAPQDGSMGGSPLAAAPLDTRVKDTLARMQAAAGVKFAG